MYGEMTPNKKAMQLNSVSSQLDFYYANGYMKCFHRCFVNYVSRLQFAVIEYYYNKKYNQLFRQEKLKMNEMPNKFPDYFKKESLKQKYKNIFKLCKKERLDILSKDFQSVKAARGLIYACMYYIKHILPYNFLLNNKKMMDKH